MPARRGKDLDLSGIGPAPQRVGIDAEDPARFPQRQPVAALERARFGDTANLGESDADRLERHKEFHARYMSDARCKRTRGGVPEGVAHVNSQLTTGDGDDNAFRDRANDGRLLRCVRVAKGL